VLEANACCSSTDFDSQPRAIIPIIREIVAGLKKFGNTAEGSAVAMESVYRKNGVRYPHWNQCQELSRETFKIGCKICDER